MVPETWRRSTRLVTKTFRQMCPGPIRRVGARNRARRLSPLRMISASARSQTLRKFRVRSTRIVRPMHAAPRSTPSGHPQRAPVAPLSVSPTTTAQTMKHAHVGLFRVRPTSGEDAAGAGRSACISACQPGAVMTPIASPAGSAVPIEDRASASRGLPATTRTILTTSVGATRTAVNRDYAATGTAGGRASSRACATEGRELRRRERRRGPAPPTIGGLCHPHGVGEKRTEVGVTPSARKITGELKLRRRPDGGGVQPRWKVVGDRHREVPAQLQAELSFRLRVYARSRKSAFLAHPEVRVGVRRVLLNPAPLPRVTRWSSGSVPGIVAPWRSRLPLGCLCARLSLRLQLTLHHSVATGQLGCHAPQKRCYEPNLPPEGHLLPAGRDRSTLGTQRRSQAATSPRSGQSTAISFAEREPPRQMEPKWLLQSPLPDVVPRVRSEEGTPQSWQRKTSTMQRQANGQQVARNGPLADTEGQQNERAQKKENQKPPIGRFVAHDLEVIPQQAGAESVRGHRSEVNRLLVVKTTSSSGPRCIDPPTTSRRHFGCQQRTQLGQPCLLSVDSHRSVQG